MTARLRAALATMLALVALLLGLGASPARAAGHSLTISKTMGEGSVPGEPLAGIIFQVNQLTDLVDLTPEQLSTLAQEDPRVLAAGSSNHTFGPALTTVTDAAGTARFDGLVDGIYLVRELPSRTGDVGWSVIAPFLVAVPGADGGDVVVRAKNQSLTLRASVDDTTVVPGQRVRFTAVGSVPAPDVDGMLHRYAIAAWPSQGLADVAVESVTIHSAEGDLVLVAGLHYTVRTDESGAIVVELTPEGLALLAARRALDPTTEVRVLVAATVAEDAERGAHLPMRFALYADGWPEPRPLRADAAATLTDIGVDVLPPTHNHDLPTATPVPTTSTPLVDPVPQAGPSDPVAVLVELARTGGRAAAIPLGALVLAAPFLILLVRRRRREDSQREESR